MGATNSTTTAPPRHSSANTAAAATANAPTSAQAVAGSDANRQDSINAFLALQRAWVSMGSPFVNSGKNQTFATAATSTRREVADSAAELLQRLSAEERQRSAKLVAAVLSNDASATQAALIAIKIAEQSSSSRLSLPRREGEKVLKRMADNGVDVRIEPSLFSEGSASSLLDTLGPASQGDNGALNAASASLSSGGSISNNCETALMVACRYNNKAIVQMLLAAGADPNKKDATGFTALHHAMIGGSKYPTTAASEGSAEAAKKDEEEKKDEVAREAAEASAGEIIALLLDHGANPNAIAIDGVSVLHYAIRQQQVLAAQQLLFRYRLQLSSATRSIQSESPLSTLLEAVLSHLALQPSNTREGTQSTQITEMCLDLVSELLLQQYYCLPPLPTYAAIALPSMLSRGLKVEDHYFDIGHKATRYPLLLPSRRGGQTHGCADVSNFTKESKEEEEEEKGAGKGEGADFEDIPMLPLSVDSLAAMVPSFAKGLRARQEALRRARRSEEEGGGGGNDWPHQAYPTLASPSSSSPHPSPSVARARRDLQAYVSYALRSYGLAYQRMASRPASLLVRGGVVSRFGGQFYENLQNLGDNHAAPSTTRLGARTGADRTAEGQRRAEMMAGSMMTTGLVGAAVAAASSVNPLSSSSSSASCLPPPSAAHVRFGEKHASSASASPLLREATRRSMTLRLVPSAAPSHPHYFGHNGGSSNSPFFSAMPEFLKDYIIDYINHFNKEREKKARSHHGQSGAAACDNNNPTVAAAAAAVVTYPASLSSASAAAGVAKSAAVAATALLGVMQHVADTTDRPSNLLLLTTGAVGTEEKEEGFKHQQIHFFDASTRVKSGFNFLYLTNILRQQRRLRSFAPQRAAEDSSAVVIRLTTSPQSATVTSARLREEEHGGGGAAEGFGTFSHTPWMREDAETMALILRGGYYGRRINMKKVSRLATLRGSAAAGHPDFIPSPTNIAEVLHHTFPDYATRPLSEGSAIERYLTLVNCGGAPILPLTAGDAMACGPIAVSGARGGGGEGARFDDDDDDEAADDRQCSSEDEDNKRRDATETFEERFLSAASTSSTVGERSSLLYRSTTAHAWQRDAPVIADDDDEFLNASDAEALLPLLNPARRRHYYLKWRHYKRRLEGQACIAYQDNARVCYRHQHGKGEEGSSPSPPAKAASETFIPSPLLIDSLFAACAEVQGLGRSALLTVKAIMSGGCAPSNAISVDGRKQHNRKTGLLFGDGVQNQDDDDNDADTCFSNAPLPHPPLSKTHRGERDVSLLKRRGAKTLCREDSCRDETDAAEASLRQSQRGHHDHHRHHQPLPSFRPAALSHDDSTALQPINSYRRVFYTQTLAAELLQRVNGALLGRRGTIGRGHDDYDESATPPSIIAFAIERGMAALKAENRRNDEVVMGKSKVVSKIFSSKNSWPFGFTSNSAIGEGEGEEDGGDIARSNEYHPTPNPFEHSLPTYQSLSALIAARITIFNLNDDPAYILPHRVRGNLVVCYANQDGEYLDDDFTTEGKHCINTKRCCFSALPSPIVGEAFFQGKNGKEEEVVNSDTCKYIDGNADGWGSSGDHKKIRRTDNGKGEKEGPSFAFLPPPYPPRSAQPIHAAHYTHSTEETLFFRAPRKGEGEGEAITSSSLESIELLWRDVFAAPYAALCESLTRLEASRRHLAAVLEKGGERHTMMTTDTNSSSTTVDTDSEAQPVAAAVKASMKVLLFDVSQALSQSLFLARCGLLAALPSSHPFSLWVRTYLPMCGEYDDDDANNGNSDVFEASDNTKEDADQPRAAAAAEGGGAMRQSDAGSSDFVKSLFGTLHTLSNKEKEEEAKRSEMNARGRDVNEARGYSRDIAENSTDIDGDGGHGHVWRSSSPQNAASQMAAHQGEEVGVSDDQIFVDAMLRRRMMLPPYIPQRAAAKQQWVKDVLELRAQHEAEKRRQEERRTELLGKLKVGGREGEKNGLLPTNASAAPSISYQYNCIQAVMFRVMAAITCGHAEASDVRGAAGGALAAPTEHLFSSAAPTVVSVSNGINRGEPFPSSHSTFTAASSHQHPPPPPSSSLLGRLASEALRNMRPHNALANRRLAEEEEREEESTKKALSSLPSASSAAIKLPRRPIPIPALSSSLAMSVAQNNTSSASVAAAVRRGAPHTAEPNPPHDDGHGAATRNKRGANKTASNQPLLFTVMPYSPLLPARISAVGQTEVRLGSEGDIVLKQLINARHDGDGGSGVHADKHTAEALWEHLLPFLLFQRDGGINPPPKSIGGDCFTVGPPPNTASDAYRYHHATAAEFFERAEGVVVAARAAMSDADDADEVAKAVAIAAMAFSRFGVHARRQPLSSAAPLTAAAVPMAGLLHHNNPSSLFGSNNISKRIASNVNYDFFHHHLLPETSTSHTNPTQNRIGNRSKEVTDRDGAVTAANSSVFASTPSSSKAPLPTTTPPLLGHNRFSRITRPPSTASSIVALAATQAKADAEKGEEDGEEGREILQRCRTPFTAAAGPSPASFAAAVRSRDYYPQRENASATVAAASHHLTSALPTIGVAANNVSDAANFTYTAVNKNKKNDSTNNDTSASSFSFTFKADATLWVPDSAAAFALAFPRLVALQAVHMPLLSTEASQRQQEDEAIRGEEKEKKGEDDDANSSGGGQTDSPRRFNGKFATTQNTSSSSPSSSSFDFFHTTIDYKHVGNTFYREAMARERQMMMMMRKKENDAIKSRRRSKGDASSFSPDDHDYNNHQDDNFHVVDTFSPYFGRVFAVPSFQHLMTTVDGVIGLVSHAEHSLKDLLDEWEAVEKEEEEAMALKKKRRNISAAEEKEERGNTYRGRNTVALGCPSQAEEQLKALAIPDVIPALNTTRHDAASPHFSPMPAGIAPSNIARLYHLAPVLITPVGGGLLDAPNITDSNLLDGDGTDATAPAFSPTAFRFQTLFNMPASSYSPTIASISATEGSAALLEGTIPSPLVACGRVVLKKKTWRQRGERAGAGELGQRKYSGEDDDGSSFVATVSILSVAAAARSKRTANTQPVWASRPLTRQDKTNVRSVGRHHRRHNPTPWYFVGSLMWSDEATRRRLEAKKNQSSSPLQSPLLLLTNRADKGRGGRERKPWERKGGASFDSDDDDDEADNYDEEVARRRGAGGARSARSIVLPSSPLTAKGANDGRLVATSAVTSPSSPKKVVGFKNDGKPMFESVTLGDGGVVKKEVERDHTERSDAKRPSVAAETATSPAKERSLPSGGGNSYSSDLATPQPPQSSSSSSKASSCSRHERSSSSSAAMRAIESLRQRYVRDQQYLRRLAATQIDPASAAAMFLFHSDDNRFVKETTMVMRETTATSESCVVVHNTKAASAAAPATTKRLSTRHSPAAITTATAKRRTTRRREETLTVRQRCFSPTSVLCFAPALWKADYDDNNDDTNEKEDEDGENEAHDGFKVSIAFSEGSPSSSSSPSSASPHSPSSSSSSSSTPPPVVVASSDHSSLLPSHRASDVRCVLPSHAEPAVPWAVLPLLKPWQDAASTIRDEIRRLRELGGGYGCAAFSKHITSTSAAVDTVTHTRTRRNQTFVKKHSIEKEKGTRMDGARSRIRTTNTIDDGAGGSCSWSLVDDASHVMNRRQQRARVITVSKVVAMSALSYSNYRRQWCGVNPLVAALGCYGMPCLDFMCADPRQKDGLLGFSSARNTSSEGGGAGTEGDASNTANNNNTTSKGSGRKRSKSGKFSEGPATSSSSASPPSPLSSSANESPATTAQQQQQTTSALRGGSLLLRGGPNAASASTSSSLVSWAALSALTAVDTSVTDADALDDGDYVLRHAWLAVSERDARRDQLLGIDSVNTTTTGTTKAAAAAAAVGGEENAEKRGEGKGEGVASPPSSPTSPSSQPQRKSLNPRSIRLLPAPRPPTVGNKNIFVYESTEVAAHCSEAQIRLSGTSDVNQHGLDCAETPLHLAVLVDNSMAPKGGPLHQQSAEMVLFMLQARTQRMLMEELLL